MFKNLLGFWKGKDFLGQVLSDFGKMLDAAEEMYLDVCKKLIHNEEEAGLEDRIYSLDKKVNAYEKDIRKRIIEHLAVQPSVDVSTSLLLMSVVKDAERLGDYSKNLLEVSDLLKGGINLEKYRQMFGDTEEKITELFVQTKEAFIDSDEDKATKSWEDKKAIAQLCDDVIKQLAQGNLPANEAVCFTLIARFFKRLTAHLTNIATSVVVPLSELDYFDERHQK